MAKGGFSRVEQMLAVEAMTLGACSHPSND